MLQDINVLALVKGEEKYVFLYDDASRAETLRCLGRFASNPELSFTWYDAAVLSQKIRQEGQKQTLKKDLICPLAMLIMKELIMKKKKIMDWMIV